MKFSLDCLTLTDTTPQDLICSAGEAGFDLVSLWVNAPAAYPRQLLQPEAMAECRALLGDHGVSLHSIEAFDLSSEASVRGYVAALERGASLGARSALVYHGANGDRAEVLHLLGLFVELAESFGLRTLVEPVAIARTRTLAEAQRLILDAQVDAGIVFDSLHFIRSGGEIAQLEAIQPKLIRYVQLNDGPAFRAAEELIFESVADRLLPGEGAFPLAEIIQYLPRDVPWGVEAPQVRSSAAGISRLDQAKAALASLRRSW